MHKGEERTTSLGQHLFGCPSSPFASIEGRKRGGGVRHRTNAKRAASVAGVALTQLATSAGSWLPWAGGRPWLPPPTGGADLGAEQAPHGPLRSAALRRGLCLLLLLLGGAGIVVFDEVILLAEERNDGCGGRGRSHAHPLKVASHLPSAAA